MSGQCQAVVCDLPVEQWMVNSSFTDMEIIEEVPTGEQFGIAVSKDNPELTAAINAALKQIRADGRYDELYEKYFGTKPSNSSSSAIALSKTASSPSRATSPPRRSSTWTTRATTRDSPSS